MDNLISYGVGILISLYIFRIWLSDLRANAARAGEAAAEPSKADQSETRPSDTFPGAFPVGAVAVAFAVVGALVLLGLEVWGEYRLDIVNQQSEMTILFGLFTLSAAFIEEVIFRGYLYYDRGSRAQLVLSILGVSLLFAALHPYIWQWNMPEGVSKWQFWQGSLSLDFSAKGLFSTAMVFVRSLWFYLLLFWPANPKRSLIPPIAAHLATNLGVFAIKAAQGSVVGWF